MRSIVVRSLIFYWRTGLAVAAGVAIATAVVTGSLVVGNSLSGSLKDAALARLGRTDSALVAARFFREDLKRDVLADGWPLGSEVAPAILVNGAVRNAQTGASAPRVQAVGVDDAFWKLFPGTEPPGIQGRDIAVNAALAADLDLHVGDDVLALLPKRGTAPAGSLFAARDREHTTAARRFTVAAILPMQGAGGFALAYEPAAPRNIFIALPELARTLGQDGQANALLAGGVLAGSKHLALGPNATAADLGFRLTVNAGHSYVKLESDALLLPPPVVLAGRQSAAECSARAAATSVALADSIASADGRRTAAYAVLAALEPLDPLPMKEGSGAPLDDNGLWLNAWIAQDLDAHVGESFDVEYRSARPDGSYETHRTRLVLRGIVDLAGPAADPGLVPEFPGITDKTSVSQWDPPFPIDLKRVTPRDEEYWDKHRATPKAFVSAATLRALWTASFPDAPDSVSSLRIAGAPGTLDALRDRFEAAFLRRVSPQDVGLAFAPVRELALASAQGSTDFGVLFLSMSFFIAASALVLCGMMTRLAAQRRAPEFGLMLACGFPEKAAVRTIVREGALLALAGAAAGAPLGVAYASAMIESMNSRWAGALGGAALSLHVEPSSLLIGLVAGLAAGIGAAAWGARDLKRRPALELLAGRLWTGTRPRARAVRVSGVVLAAALAGAALLVALSLGFRVIPSVGAFFGVGATLLVASIAAAHRVLCSAARNSAGSVSTIRLALRGASANRGRSLLAFGLSAAAAFVIVAVAANRRQFLEYELHDLHGPSGGFTLRATSTLPIPYDLGTPAGRKKLGFSPEDEKLFGVVEVVSCFMSSGADVSCLNVSRPVEPRVLGVPDALIARNAFAVTAESPAPGANPWSGIQSKPAAGVVPIFGDADSVQWQLHSSLGGTISVFDAARRPVACRFAGLISSSILAGELLMSEANYRRLFPDDAGPRYFLIAAPPGRETAVADALRRNLGDRGLDVRESREILTALAGVQNTYLAMFLVLGGLGALLGTFGLTIVLLRSALERRGEFALMLAVGFDRTFLARLLVLENGALLAAGLIAGTVAALVAVIPAVASGASRADWISAAGVLAAMLALGLACCAAAAASAVRGKLLQALRAE